MSDKEPISANTKGTIHDLELTFAEWFGRGGNGGRMKTMEDKMQALTGRLDAIEESNGEKHDKHEGRIQVLEVFKGKAMLVGSLLLTAGGALAGTIAKLIEKWL